MKLLEAVSKCQNILLLLLLMVIVSACARKPKQLVYDINDFRDAMYTDDLETMRLCIEKGSVMDISEELLYVSSRSVSGMALEFLLELGADPNYVVELARDPTWEHGTDILIRNPGGYDPKSRNIVYTTSAPHILKRSFGFPLANTDSSPEQTRMLIEYGADVNKLVEPNANLLMSYIESLYTGRSDYRNERMESIRLLLDNGADVSFRGENGLSPLLVALNYRQRDAAALLIEYGAQPSAELFQIELPHDNCLRGTDSGYRKMVCWQSDFLMMARGGMSSILMPYIESGAITPDHATPDGFDIYFFAAEKGNRELMMKLLPYLDDINAKRYDSGFTGMTLLHVAAFYENAETAKVLLANGIDVDAEARYFGEGFRANVIARDMDIWNPVIRAIADFPRYNDYAEYRIAE